MKSELDNAVHRFTQKDPKEHKRTQKEHKRTQKELM